MSSLTPEATKAFEILYGRAPSDAERVRLLRIKDAIGLRDDDGVWAIFIALGHFQALYEDIPRRIEAAANKTAAAYRVKPTKYAIRDVALIAAVTIGTSLASIGLTSLGIYSWYRGQVDLARTEIYAKARQELDRRIGEDEQFIRTLRQSANIQDAFPPGYADRLVNLAAMPDERIQAYLRDQPQH
jgi:hypothetical protein